jgi:hypothetical protein
MNNEEPTVQNEPPATWWTPAGWQKKPAPAAYQKMISEADEVACNWNEMLKKAGYTLRTHYWW